MIIPPVRAEFFQLNGTTNIWTATTDIVADYRNFTNAPKHEKNSVAIYSYYTERGLITLTRLLQT